MGWFRQARPSQVVGERTDFSNTGGSTTEVTYLKASADRSAVGIVAGDISSGPVYLYSSTTNTFTPQTDLNTFTSFVALSKTGSTVMVNPGTYVLGKNLLLAGTIPGGTYGVASDPNGTVGYRVSSTGIDVLDLTRFLKTGTLNVGDTLSNANTYRHGVGELSISGDGSVLALITDHGVSLVQSTVAGVVNFAALSASATIELTHGTTLDSFAATGSIQLGTTSSGINPTLSGATLDFGRLSLNLPAKSFASSGGNFSFNGTVQGISINLSLMFAGPGAYSFSLTGSHATLLGSSLPISLGLAIGTDGGSVTLDTGSVTIQSH